MGGGEWKVQPREDISTWQVPVYSVSKAPGKVGSGDNALSTGSSEKPKTPIDLIKANEEINARETADAVQQ